MEPVRTVGTEAGLGGRQPAAPGPALPAAPVCWGERPRPEASSSSPAPPALQLEAGPAGETQLRRLLLSAAPTSQGSHTPAHPGRQRGEWRFLDMRYLDTVGMTDLSYPGIIERYIKKCQGICS